MLALISVNDTCVSSSPASSVMSLARVALVVLQALSNQWALTPPNPTLPKDRYHTEELYILQIAPLIFKVNLIEKVTFVDADAGL